jgi:adenylosuccinate synthase
VRQPTLQTLAVVGGQWGDEGKGKLVDLLGERYQAVARYHGGHNAGHTVRFGDRHFALHLLPVGVLRSKLSLIGSGVVIEPESLLDEIEAVERAGIAVRDNLRISERAHLILPYHQLLDRAREADADSGKIGTTLRGIGPAYESRAARTGVRVEDLRHEKTLPSRVARLAREKTILLRALGLADVPLPERVAERLLELAPRILPYVCDTGALAREHLARGGTLLAEGAHGGMLDIDSGTYPYVTSSTCTSASVAAGLQIPPTALDGTLVIVKAYTTRVGFGPFPTELNEATGEYLRKRGNEYGTTTGRPRRVGWFDAPVARASVALSGAAAVAITKLDVLDELEEILVGTHYRLAGRELEWPPAEADDLARIEVVYRRFPGWRIKTTGITEFDLLPDRARAYVRFLEELVGAEAAYIATGPKREETIIRMDGHFVPRLPPAPAP